MISEDTPGDEDGGQVRGVDGDVGLQEDDVV